MNIYIAILLIWLLISSLIQYCRFSIKIKGIVHCTITQRELIVLLFVLLFGSLLSFRGLDVGYDTRFYSQMFMDIGSFDDITKYYMFVKAPVYVILCKLVYLISDAPNAMMIFSGFSTVCITAYFINKKSEDVVFSLFLFVALDFYLFSFNGSRQMLSLALLLIVYMLWDEGKIKSGLMFLMLATGIHITALLFIAVLPLFMYKINYKRFLGVNAFIFVVEMLAMKFLSIFQKFFDSYSNLNEMGYNLTTGDSSGGRVVYALIFIIIELLVFNYNKKQVKWAYSPEFLRLSTIVNVSLISMILYRHYYVFARVEKVFFVFGILLLPTIYKHLINRDSRWIVKVLTYIVFMIPFITQTLKYLPYSIFW